MAYPLNEYNNRCVPPWSEKELRHKIASANNLQRHSRPRGYLLGSTNPPKVARPVPRILGQVKIPEVNLPATSAIEANVLSTPESKEPVAMLVEAPPQDTEAHRIAGELLKLYECGVINGANDPEAAFFASVIHKFKVTIPKESPIEAGPDLTNKTSCIKLISKRIAA